MMAVLLAAVLVGQLPQSIPFDQFLISERAVQSAVRPHLQDREARRYQTVLRAESSKGPNFAGHFTVVRIGCGTGCSRLAVVDAISGAVIFPKTVPFIYTAGWWREPAGAVFRLDSRLFVVYGQTGSENAPYGISYFEWTGRDFRLLRFEKHDRGKP